MIGGNTFGKPMSVQRVELINRLCNLLNEYELPIFVKVDIIERILNELRQQIDVEYQRDLALYNEKKEVVNDGDE